MMREQVNGLAGVVLIAAAGIAGAQEAGWQTQLESAKRQAVQSGRPILVFFTDSVQCPWCAKLRKDVLDSPEFRKWAGESVVLLELDFPTGKNQEPAVKTQNEAIKKKFAVRSYPMVLFIKADETELGRIPGYPTPAKTAAEARDKWLAQARGIVAKARP